MGSCSNKSNNEGVPSIQTISIRPEIKSSIENDIANSKVNIQEIKEENKIDKNRLEIPTPNHIISVKSEKDESGGRKARKNLTVLATNDDNFEFPKEFSNERSIIKSKNEGKQEQGSLVIVRQPITVGGMPSNNIQPNFEEKLVTIQGDDVKREFLLDHGIWACCKKGLKPESPNQDDFVVVVEENSITLGVFDGHGSHGHEISNYIQTNLPKMLLSHPSWDENPLASYTECFPQAHLELISFCNKPTTKFDCTISGCTSTILTIKQNKIYAGNVGDSRAVLARKSEGRLLAIDLTRDHKPTHEDEKARIERMGGEVKKIEGDIPFRVFAKGKQYPGIAMSRALGDALAQTVGVTCIPETKFVEITENDEFVVACSDGMWEFISSQEAVDEIKKHTNIKESAESLAQLAWDRWLFNEVDIVDDITVILFYLKHIPI